MKPKQVGLRDVAVHAGVSLGTVSNVLAGRPRVAPSTRAAVLAAVGELGYRAPRRSFEAPLRRIEMIGLVFRHGPSILTNQFYSHVLHGTQAACAARGIGLTHETAAAPGAGPGRLPLMLEQKRVDGLLVLGYVEPSFLSLLETTGVPFVLVDHHLRPLQADSVCGDDEEGGYLATRHLLDRGHRDPVPAALLGPLAHASFRDRYAGYCRALADADLPADEGFVRVDDSLGGRVPEAIDALLALPKTPTAIFCANDDLAVRALAALRERGVAVPAAVSIVGYDDIAWAAHAAPPLTTIRVDKELLGAQGVRMLIERIEYPEMPPRLTRLGVSLVERSSVQPPAAGA